jgi:F0F1-type ATP synthase delta subunit
MPLIILLGFVFAVMVVLFQRIMKQNVVLATRHLEEMGQDYAKKQQEIDIKLKETEHKCQDMILKAEEEAEQVKEKMIKEGTVERDRILDLAHHQSEDMIQQADKSRKMLLAEINDRISREATDKACELIRSTLPDKFKLDVHTHWVEELITGDFSHLDRLHIPKGAGEVKIASAFPLSDSQRKILRNKLKEVLGNEVDPKEEVESDLVAGVIIYIGSLVLDGSLRNKVQEQSKKM